MRILILSDSDSPHTIKWVRSLAEQNIEIGIFSIHKANVNLYVSVKNLKIYDLGVDRKVQNKGEKDLTKIQYFKGIKELKKVISVFNPDILHAHYASSYGFLGALTGFQPYVVSVWGTDVYSFPNKSFLHRSILKYNLARADKILSTSKAMRDELRKYTSKEIIVTPFGIDINRFKPDKVEGIFGIDDFVIGTIKTLERNYGIEYLIRAFKSIKQKFQLQSFKLMITGKGTQELYLKSLVNELHIQDDVVFTGYINPEKVSIYHNMLDVAVFPSIEESFGVAVLEASSCEKPVIVSNVGGLPEVVEDKKTGFIIEKGNIESIVLAIEKLIIDVELRHRMGKNGREKVINEYDWQKSVFQMISIYDEIYRLNNY